MIMFIEAVFAMLLFVMALGAYEVYSIDKKIKDEE